eukprot:scaffold71196_cov63-Phaeocystis_antarctica.AAC.1
MVAPLLSLLTPPLHRALPATTARATSEVAARAPWLGGGAGQILLAAQSAEQRRGGGAWRVVGWRSAVLTSGAAGRARPGPSSRLRRGQAG